MAGGFHKTTKLATVSGSPIKRVAKCYENMDTKNCPDSCTDGQFCDGLHCVQKSECTCQIEGKIVRVSNSSDQSCCGNFNAN